MIISSGLLNILLFNVRMQIDRFVLMFFNKDPEDFLLFNSVGYSLQQGYEAQSFNT